LKKSKSLVLNRARKKRLSSAKKAFAVSGKWGKQKKDRKLKGHQRSGKSGRHVTAKKGKKSGDKKKNLKRKWAVRRKAKS